MLRSHFALLRFALLAAASLSGCNLLTGEDDPAIRAEGTVVLAETGEPVRGLGVAIVRVPPSWGGSEAVETVRTDAEGRFALSYEVELPSRSSSGVNYAYSVIINTAPYDSRYSKSGRVGVNPPVDIDFGVVELEEREGN